VSELRLRRLLAGATAILAAAAATTGAPRAQAPTTGELLARYQPVVYAYASDWTPVAVEDFLAGAALERRSAGRWRVLRVGPSPAQLGDASGTVRLDLRGCTPAVDLDSCYVERARGAAQAPTVYGRAVRRPSAGGGTSVILQYWLLYPVNDWRNPIRTPAIWQMHEGDWELVSVEVGADGSPSAVAASQHTLGVWRPWPNVRKRGTHPVVYSALGSHAVYFLPGFHGSAGAPHRIPPRFSGVPVAEPDFTAAQASWGPFGVAATAARVVDVSAGPASVPWLRFAGPWGDGNYVLLRSGSSAAFIHVRVGDSPPGPAFHGAWRNPAEPFRRWPADDGH